MHFCCFSLVFMTVQCDKCLIVLRLQLLAVRGQGIESLYQSDPFLNFFVGSHSTCDAREEIWRTSHVFIWCAITESVACDTRPMCFCSFRVTSRARCFKRQGKRKLQPVPEKTEAACVGRIRGLGGERRGICALLQLSDLGRISIVLRLPIFSGSEAFSGASCLLI